ncbi:hypothetical protein KLPMMM105M1_12745 [Klebsiella pneumoniae]
MMNSWLKSIKSILKNTHTYLFLYQKVILLQIIT